MTSEQRHRRGTRARGFTLLELLVGVTLAVTLLGAMAWFVSDLVDTRDRLAAASSRDGAATTIFERLESDLNFVVTADVGGSGVRGDSTSLILLTRGVLLAKADGRLGDLQRQEYRFDPERRALVARRAEMSAGSAGASETYMLLDDRLERVRFRYHDGSEWLSDFDSRRDGGLPTLVEISLWWAPRRSDSDDSIDATTADRLRDDDALDDFADFADLFDEEAIEFGADDEMGDVVRRPDRRRVIRVPDARPVDPEAAIEFIDGLPAEEIDS